MNLTISLQQDQIGIGWFFTGRLTLNRVLAEHRYVGKNGLSEKEK